MKNDRSSSQESSKSVTAAERIKAVKKELLELSEGTYATFSRSLIPGADNLLGVRIPKLRTIAKREAKNDWLEFLRAADESSFEMIMLQGMVIGYAKSPPETIIEELEKYVQKITNWSLCDSPAATLKISEKYPDLFFTYALKCLESTKEFTVRFGIVLLLMHFSNDMYYRNVLKVLNQPSYPGYYASMAAAWAVSVLFVKYPEDTEKWLKTCRLDDQTFEKSIRKIRESYCVSKDAKKRVCEMRRQSSIR